MVVVFVRNHTTPGLPYTDKSDAVFGCNGIAMFGEIESSFLYLWEAKVRFQTIPGDIIFFMSKLFTHNAADYVAELGILIQRCIIDTFTHNSILI